MEIILAKTLLMFRPSYIKLKKVGSPLKVVSGSKEGVGADKECPLMPLVMAFTAK